MPEIKAAIETGEVRSAGGEEGYCRRRSQERWECLIVLSKV